jgi:hypothetical protein
MQTLCEQRQEIYKNPGLIFCCPLPLYALAERNPRPDCPDYAEIACERIQGVEGVLLCLSPVDAMIYRAQCNSAGRKYEVFPYEAIDPRIFIQSHDHCLSLYIVYGFEARNNKLLLNREGYPNELIWPIHFKFSPEDIEEHFCLGFGEGMTGWLDALHRKAGLSDYRSHVHEQADLAMDDLDFAASTALQVAEYMEKDSAQDTTQCAIYDPVESQWRFVDFADMDLDDCREYRGNVS